MVASPRAVDRAPVSPAPRVSRRKACYVAHTEFIDDTRVRREAEALLADGWDLDVVCLHERGAPWRVRHGAARVYHLPVRRHRGSSRATYALEYAAFFLLAAAWISWLGLRRRYALVQAHNLPDFLVFTAVLPRLLGARIILDVHDPLPDLYASKFGGAAQQPLMRLVRWIEARSTAFADHVLTPGEPSRRRLISRGLRPEKVTNVMNSADPELFSPVRRPDPAEPERAFTLVYHGGLFERYGLDIAIRAVDRLRCDIPGLRFRIFGAGEESERLRRLVDQLDLADRVSISGWVPPPHIPALVASASVGVVPYRRNAFTDLVYPTKAFEYLAMGMPVILSRLGGLAELFPDVPDLFFPPDDVEGLAAHILALYREPARLRRLAEAGARAYAPYAWESQRRHYLALANRLTDDSRVPLV